MIFKFDDSVKTDDDKERHLLAKCLRLMNEKGHKVERNGCYLSYIEKKILVITYVGERDIDLIERNRAFFDVTSSNREDYRCVTIGYGEGMCSPADTYLVLNEPSLVIVENKTNDGSVITRWAECYKDEGKAGDVNECVLDAIRDKRLRFLNAGGGDGTIIKRIEDERSVFGGFPHFKITTVYDSDKNSANDTNNHNKVLEDYLTANNYKYHCLLKREMENYFPITVYGECGLLRDGKTIPPYSDVDWDYLEIKEEKDKRPGEQDFMYYEKKLLPDLAAKACKKHFKQRVAHQSKYNSHYGEVDEIQHVLLMLAQYI